MPQTEKPQRACWIATAALTAGALLFYGLTLEPTLTGGDSGELICAAAELGVAHPPGYPLWTMLAHAFTWLPSGSLAWRVNLMSALCAAGAAGLLCRTVQLWTTQWWAGLLAGGLFAFSPLVWTYATQAEVFALNNLLVAGVLWSATRFALHHLPRKAGLCAFYSGLALANHHTAIFVVAPIALWVFVRLLRLRRERGRAIAIAALGAVLGLAPYAYLPLAGAFSDGLIWGEPANLRGFLDHFLRREYGTFQLADGELASRVSLPLLLGRYLASAFTELWWIGLPLSVMGIVAILARRTPPSLRWLAAALLLSLAAYLLVFQSLVNLSPENPLLAGVVARFWMMPNLLLALLAGAGAAWWATSASTRILHLLAIASVGAVTSAATFRWREQALSSRLIEDYGRAILESLPPGAVLLVRGDLPSNASRYIQTAEAVRKDVIVIDLELLTRRWYARHITHRHPAIALPGAFYHPGVPGGFTLAALVEANRRHSLWVCPEPKPGDPSVATLSFWPEGFPQRILSANERPEIAEWDRLSRQALRDLHPRFAPQWERTAPGSWEREAVLDYWSAEHRHAFTWLAVALREPADTNALAQARRAYEKFAAEARGETWFAWKNLGMIYERMNVMDPTQRANIVRAWRRYLELAPPDHEDRQAVEEALRRYEPR